MPDRRRASPLWFCPICDQLRGGWLSEIARDLHMMDKHRNVEFPDGDGLAEWRAFRARAKDKNDSIR